MKIRGVLWVLCTLVIAVVIFISGAFIFDKNPELKNRWDTIVEPINYGVQKITGRGSYRIIPEFNNNHRELDLAGEN